MAILLALSIAIVSAIVGGIVGALVQKRVTPDPTAELRQLRDQVATFQRRIESLEKERRAWDELSRFTPTAEIVGQLPEGQRLALKADRSFTLKRIDYLGDGDAMVSYDDVNASGEKVEARIDSLKIVHIFNLTPRMGYTPIPMKFRCSIVIDGFEKTHTIEAIIRPEFKMINGVSTTCMTVIGGL